MSTTVGSTGVPKAVEAAFVLSLAAAAAEAVIWVLVAFVLAPTEFDEMRSEVGRHDALVQLGISAGATLVICAVWLLCTFRMRAGANWARLVLTAGGVLAALFRLNDLSMSGFPWNGETVMHAVPDLLAAVVVVLMYLPPSGAHFAHAARTQ
jgi:hypothetical protein